MRTRTLLAALALLTLVTAAGPTTQTNDAAPRQRFAFVYAPGPKWLAERPVWEQPLQAHGDYMHQLFVNRKLVMGGPFTDSTGGLAIVDAADEHAARAILDADPAVRGGVFTATLHPWFPVDWQTYGK